VGEVGKVQELPTLDNEDNDGDEGYWETTVIFSADGQSVVDYESIYYDPEPEFPLDFDYETYTATEYSVDENDNVILEQTVEYEVVDPDSSITLEASIYNDFAVV